MAVEAELRAPLPEPIASRAAGRYRLETFASSAGRAYAAGRNYDLGPGHHERVSRLSPYLRHRLITESEVLAEVLAGHSRIAAEKFIQEVVWRTYFKGWLEHRPSVWSAYRHGLDAALLQLEGDDGIAAQYAAAVAGRTGMECMDAWAAELVDTGYLHNHARMWFASIWVFTLRLPWELGADFFLRHLCDGDPASNTLGWRWVCGLHTKGKTYLARADNIDRYTNGRFASPDGLASSATPLTETADHPLVPVPPVDDVRIDDDYALLITEEDCAPESLQLARPAALIAAGVATGDRSPLPVGARAQRFARAAVDDAVTRIVNGTAGADTIDVSNDWTALVAELANRGLRDVVTAYAPVGPVADRLTALRDTLDTAGMRLHLVRRRYDELAWPHATKGFFKLKSRIPTLLDALGL